MNSPKDPRKLETGCKIWGVTLGRKLEEPIPAESIERMNERIRQGPPR